MGGDQMTASRTENAQTARCDGESSEECLTGLVGKFEDWHAIRIAYQVIIF